jgi:tetratricopeptide (TPR) repeat protein
MESLSELIRLVTKKRVKKVELFDENSRNKSSNYFKLFDGIHSEKYQSDADAAKDIYACDPSEKKYLILKTRLKQKLLNTLFFLDFEDENTPQYKAVLYECNKALYCAKVLLMNGSKRIAIPAIEKTLKRAQEFHLTDIELECAKILRSHYSTSNQYKEFVLSKELADQIEQRLHAENISDRYYQELVAMYAKSKSNRPKVKRLAEKYYKALQEDFKKYDSTKLSLNYFKIKTMFHQFSDDYASAIEVTEQAEAYVKKNPKFHPAARIEELAIQKMNFYLHLKNFEAGDTYAKKTLTLFEEGSANWYNFQEYYLLLAMHTGQYLKAAEIFQSVVELSSFRLLSDVKKERWRVFQAYLHYIYKSQKLKEIRPAIQNAKTNFRVNEFLTEKPSFAKERRGLNIATLTVQIMFFLEKFETDKLNECVSAIAKYCRRYPKKDINFRSECFIEMLVNMSKEDFRFYQTRKASEKMYEEMISVHMEYHGGNRALEVLPYEVMWNIILDRLKTYKYG